VILTPAMVAGNDNALRGTPPERAKENIMGFIREALSGHGIPKSEPVSRQETQIINLTPHDIVFAPQNIAVRGKKFVIPASGMVARVAAAPSAERKYGVSGMMVSGEGCPFPGEPSERGIPVYDYPAYGPVDGLPDPAHRTIYIVSGMVLGHCAGRSDVFGPGTGPEHDPVRNDKGHIVAIRCLIAAPEVAP
jgi:hypothetical protein